VSTAQQSDRVSAALSAAAIAASVGGTVEGDDTVAVLRVASLAAADRSSISFLGAARYADDASRTNAGVVMVTAALASHVTHVPARIIVQAPQDSILAALALLYKPVPLVPGVHANVVRGVHTVIDASARVEAGAVLGDGVTIGARTRIASGVVIGGGVTIGDDCVLYPNVTVYDGTTIGDRVQLHAGAVLGSDGFGYAFRDGAHQKIPHIGRCRIESDVEIGANTTVDRGSVDDTVIGAGTKIDNLCHIAHNVQIGRLCLLMAHVGISGSTRLGDGVIVAGQAGLAGHVTIGSGARIAGGSGVFGNVPAGETWSGYPARPHRQWLRAQAALFKLPALLKSLSGQKGSE
jgi:UDP-3-O-[3-hydroxymyristoyl] glucosamine N-acyltransferase